MQISDLPSTTTFDDNTVLAIENAAGGSNVTSKVTGATLKTALTSDTGWNDLTLSSGISGSIQYRVVNHVLYLNGKSIATGTGSVINLALLPSEIRPTVQWTVKPSYPHFANSTFINITTGGYIQVSNYTGAAISNIWFTTAVPI